MGSAILTFILCSVAIGSRGRHSGSYTRVQGWGHCVALLRCCGRVWRVSVLGRLGTVSVVRSGEGGGVSLGLGMSWGRACEGV